jgi:hypothetical protein
VNATAPDRRGGPVLITRSDQLGSAAHRTARSTPARRATIPDRGRASGARRSEAVGPPIPHSIPTHGRPHTSAVAAIRPPIRTSCPSPRVTASQHRPQRSSAAPPKAVNSPVMAIAHSPPTTRRIRSGAIPGDPLRPLPDRPHRRRRESPVRDTARVAPCHIGIPQETGTVTAGDTRPADQGREARHPARCATTARPIRPFAAMTPARAHEHGLA